LRPAKNQIYTRLLDNLTHCQIALKIWHSEMLQSHRILRTSTYPKKNSGLTQALYKSK
jgi:hypothetical protein